MSQIQTYQVSRISRESPAFSCRLPLTRRMAQISREGIVAAATAKVRK